jgi:hypothetical protein
MLGPKRKLFHILNQRARRQEYEQAQREYELMKALESDPRRDHLGDDLKRVYPLIEDEN